MIIAKLMGGLGNQMFQYAVGKQLACLNRATLKLDVSAYENDEKRKYALGEFNIEENFASPEEVKALTCINQSGVKKLISRIMPGTVRPAPTHIVETHFSFDPDVCHLPDGVYLDGYWQSEKYFLDIESVIRKEFTVKTPQAGKNKALAEQITSCESVSLHIRRADYANSAEINKRYGTCSLDYYDNSIKGLVDSVRNPHFFIFSDDPMWVSNNLKLSYPAILVDHNAGDKSYEDLRLMSQCKYNIIANSSFSWWGAWLNSYPDKRVYAPKRWLADTGAAPNYNDFIDNLLPYQWIRG